MIIPKPINVSASVGDSVSINCSASGRPLPSLSWYKDEVQLDISGRITITDYVINFTHIDSVLTVSSVTYDDEGVYTCNATNTLPNEIIVVRSISFTVNVSK